MYSLVMLSAALGAVVGAMVGALAQRRWGPRCCTPAEDGTTTAVSATAGVTDGKPTGGAAAAAAATSTSPPASLRQVIVIFRHGARLPSKGVMSGDLGWPDSPDFWKSYAGQLTPLGCQQLMRVGADLRERYVAGSEKAGALGGLLADVPCEEAGLHVVAYCSFFQRTLFSAWSFLHGFLPEVPRFFCNRAERVLLDYQTICRHYYGTAGSGTTMGVPIIVQDKEVDCLLRQWEAPPMVASFKEWQETNMEKAPTLARLADDPEMGGLPIADKLWRMTGMKALEAKEGRSLKKRLMALRTVQTQIEIAQVHGMPILPNEAGLQLTQEELAIIDAVAKEQKRYWFHAAEGAGPDRGDAAATLAHLIWWHMARMDNPDVWQRQFSDGDEPPAEGRGDHIYSDSPENQKSSMNLEEPGQRQPKRLVIFSAHDTTIMALAAKLGVDLPPPEFGGYFLFELHYGGHVHSFYNRDPLSMPMATLRSRQLPLDKCAGSVPFDRLPEGSTSLDAFKHRCQIEALKANARTISQISRRSSWSFLQNGEFAEHQATVVEPASPSVSLLQEPGVRLVAGSLLLDMDPKSRERAEEAFHEMDPNETGRVSVGDLVKTANLLGVNIPPSALQLAIKCFADEKGASFTERRFLELMALLDHSRLEE